MEPDDAKAEEKASIALRNKKTSELIQHTLCRYFPHSEFDALLLLRCIVDLSIRCFCVKHIYNRKWGVLRIELSDSSDCMLLTFLDLVAHPISVPRCNYHLL